jgi:hypothetical protein
MTDLEKAVSLLETLIENGAFFGSAIELEFGFYGDEFKEEIENFLKQYKENQINSNKPNDRITNPSDLYQINSK